MHFSYGLSHLAHWERKTTKVWQTIQLHYCIASQFSIYLLDIIAHNFKRNLQENNYYFSSKPKQQQVEANTKTEYRIKYMLSYVQSNRVRAVYAAWIVHVQSHGVMVVFSILAGMLQSKLQLPSIYKSRTNNAEVVFTWSQQFIHSKAVHEAYLARQ